MSRKKPVKHSEKTPAEETWGGGPPPAAPPRVLNSGGLECVTVDRLILHPRNPNEGDFGAIYESIKANGFYGALIVQRSTSYILAGNWRYRAAVELGYGELPVIWLDVDDAEALRILLADNRTTRLGSDDPTGLAELLQSILSEQGGLDGTGYDRDALDDIMRELGDGLISTDSQAQERCDQDGALPCWRPDLRITCREWNS